MNPPVDLVEDHCRVLPDAGERLRQNPAGKRPVFPRGMGHVDPQRLADESGHDNRKDQQKDDPIIGGVLRSALVTETVGLPDIAAVDRQQHADQDEQPEEVHHKRENQVEPPPQKDPPQERTRDVGFLGDQGRPDEEDPEAEEDQAVHDPGIGVAKGFHLEESVQQQRPDPLPEAIHPDLRLAQGDPHLPAPVDPVGEDCHGEGRQGIKKNTERLGVPVDLPPLVTNRKRDVLHNPSR